MMHSSLSLSLFGGLLALGALLGCSSGPEQRTVMLDPSTTAGTTSGGSGTGGGAGDTSGAGSAAIAGSATAGGMTSGGSGGSAGSAPDAGGSGGSAGSGGSGGASGSGGSGGMPEDPNKKVLFDGSPATFNAWKSVRNGGANPWQNNGDGTMTVKTNTGDIQTAETFNDVFVHLEYMTPKITSAGGGQERGNSGVYMKGSYEAQVLDTYGLPPASDGCGAIYGISAPLKVACFDAEEWNVYEIEFKANTCQGGQKSGNAVFTEVKLNGEVVQQNVAVPGTTQAGQPESCDPKGILLQDHSSILPVTFRNIWVIPRN
jgi:hypothetical protein